MQIGFLDSGIGGLTVLREALDALPNENYAYYADSLHAPYGTKPKDEVRGYIFEAVEFMIGLGIKALVIACNTATIVAVNELRAKYSFPIIGMEPAVKPAVEQSLNQHKRVLVTATPLALAEEKFRSLVARVDNEHIVDLLPLPELVEYAQSFIFDEAVIKPYLERKLAAYDLDRYGTLVLGCTHFPHYREIFREILPPGIAIIDGGAGTVRRLQTVLAERGLLATGSGRGTVSFYISGRLETDPGQLVKYWRLLGENGASWNDLSLNTGR
jgi:glutamate racemase